MQTLCSFSGTNGATPLAALTLGNDGNFYGTTYYGGITNSTWTRGMGTVFRITANGALTTLVSLNGTNGMHPRASLTLANDGNLYGTTEEGGSSDNGTVFQVTTNGTLTMLVSLNATNRYPAAELTLGSDGNFYGTTFYGGSSNAGTIFRMTTNGTLATLASFYGTKGMNPLAALTLGNDGIFYGTTFQGGNTNLESGYGRGTVFKVTTNGTLTTLVAFNFTNGAYPLAALTLGSDGKFYGTTSQGGSGGKGTLFKVTPNGTLTTLVSFGDTNGASPHAALALGNDGDFCGTTSEGGITNSTYTRGMGTVFRMTPNGTLTTLVSFGDTNGASPYAALTLGNDGDFYGTTSQGDITNSRYNPRHGNGVPSVDAAAEHHGADDKSAGITGN